MQTLVSTRLFSDAPLDGDALRLLAERGFLSIELLATPERIDLRSPARSRALHRQLEAAGMRAPWVYLDPSYLALLDRGLELQELTASLVALRAEALVLPRGAWAAGRASLPGIEELRSYVQRAGASLLGDAASLDDAPVQASPDLGFCWDVASRDEGRKEADEEALLEQLPERRLRGLRLAHRREGRRDPPEEEEARLLETLWPKLAPRTLVYDVETRGGAAEVRRALEEIRAFHAGERRPPGERSGGLFWSSLAPG